MVTFSYRLLAVGAFLIGSAVFAIAGEAPGLTVTSTEKMVSRLIDNLDNPNFTVRRQATERLASIGAPAISPLLEAAEGGSLEAAVRAVAILERIYVTVDEGAVEEAEQAFERLQASTNHSIALRADRAMNSNYSIRHKRAVAQIKQLGGLVKFTSTTDVRVPNSPDTSIYWIVLGRKWKGGDEGLKYIRRLTQLKTLYVINGTDISDDALTNLRSELPDLSIHRRGEAYLGIGASPAAGGCEVARVEPDTAAEKAGIRPRDVITTFDGKPTPTFEKLVEFLRSKKAGDEVKLGVLRGNRTRVINVKLGEWVPRTPQPSHTPEPPPATKPFVP